MTTVERVLVLKQIDLLESAGPRHLLALAELVREVEMFQGQAIYGEADLADAIYVVFKGRVTSIGALALEGASSNAAGKYFQMTVAMEGHDERLRPGMTARVAIIADRAKDVLVVPIPAIFYLGEQPVCFVAEGNNIISRPVRVFM